MNWKLFGFAAFAVMAMVGPLFAALSIDASTVSVTPATIKPGEDGAVTFSIKNVLPSTSTTVISPLEDVHVFFSAVQGINYNTKSPYVVGTIDSGGSSSVTVSFKVLQDAKSGITTLPFYISQKDKTDLKTISAAVKVVNPPVFTISSDHQTILNTDYLTLNITNDGGAANRIALKLADSSKFAFMGTTQVYVGTIPAASSVAVGVAIDSRNVDEGVSSIPFVINYQTEGGDTVSENKSLSVAVKKEKADVVFTQQGPLVTSKEGVLSLNVKNTGRTLDDFKVYLDDASIKARESTQYKLGTLKSGEEKKVEMKVFPSLEPGVKSVKLRLTWVEDDVEKEETTYVPIVVQSDADTAIFVDAKPSPIVAGGDHTLSITVSNVGSYKIQNVEVSFDGGEAFDVFNAQKSQYIGGLESDDFSSVQFKVRAKAALPGSYPVTVGVKYKDQSGLWVEKDQAISLAVRSPSDALPNGGNGSPLPILAVVAVAGGAAYWYFRMRKAGKPSSAGGRTKEASG